MTDMNTNVKTDTSTASTVRTDVKDTNTASTDMKTEVKEVKSPMTENSTADNSAETKDNLSQETHAEEILSHLIVICGLTAHDSFERVYNIQRTKEALLLITTELDFARKETLGRLIDKGQLQSDDGMFSIEEVKECFAVVDKRKLLREEPVLYEKLARISASVFLRELGHDALRSLLIEKMGVEKVHHYDSVNVTDFTAARRGEETAGEFIHSSEHTAGFRLVKKEYCTDSEVNV